MDAGTSDEARRARSARSPGRRARRSLGAAALVVAAAGGSLPGAPAASAAPGDPVGCGYGTTGPSAGTLCWIDLSGYVDATARSGAGQPLSATLPGGYTVDVTVRTSGTRAVAASAFPTWDYGAAIGKYIYLGTPGQPALYQGTGQGAESTTIALTDISVEDSGGNAVHGWRFVGADAEATADTESITFTSDAPVSTLASFTPPGGTNGCQFNVTQVDANTVQCTGTAVGDVYGTVLVGATEPTSFSQTMTVGNGASREAVAFAFQTSTLEAGITIDGRDEADDTFAVEITSPEDTTVASAATAATDGATTGAYPVLPRVDGSSYTVELVPDSGVDLAAYSILWTCTRDDVFDFEATDVTSVTISPEAGEAAECTVDLAVAQVPPTSTTTTTSAPTTSTTTSQPTTSTSTATTAAVDTSTTSDLPADTTPPAAAPSTGPTVLVRTGSDQLPLAATGALLLALGAVTIRLGAKRRSTP